MATKETNSPQNGSSKPQESTPTDLADNVQNLHLGETPPDSDSNDNDAARPVYIYTRPQLLTILKSPLVNPPANMPNLVQWLGPGDSETSVKKDSENSSLGAPRDRRFRRDNEDGEAPMRPSFRSSLSQPSQMGNFKHQSSRTTERDRDLDRDHDKDSNERLRSLSDKFDRERLNGARAKDRDAAPHLPSGANRMATQNNGTTRRSEQREGSKKKSGESSEDWRKGADASRAARDDKREDRERARSRPRDSSKTRREPSTTRRDRDREDVDRDRYRRVDRDRDDYRKEREAYRREREREEDNEDPRRWRDDGRREERLANARRERERAGERERDPNWDDRRWTVVEDRDARTKRAGREKRQNDEGKDREERKEREREREKEKEPAWMDSTAPTSGGSGIIGGRAADGELDQIQAWKKSVKEREQKEKEKASGKNTKGKAEPEPPTELPLSAADPSAKHLDEIQLFKLIMKREGEKKKSDSPSDSPSLPPAPHPTLVATESLETNTKAPGDPRDLLAMLAAGTPSSAATSETSADKGASSDLSVPKNGVHEPNPAAPSATTAQLQQFQPPPGSRLLAMRNPSTQTVPMASKSPVGALPGSPSLTDPHLNSSVNSMAPGNYPGGPGPQAKTSLSKADMLRQGFTPFEEQSRLAFGFEDSQQQIAQDMLRRQAGALGGDVNEMMALEHANGANFASAGRGGGSRFAKFFDKAREPELVSGGGLKGQNAPGFIGSVPGLHQRPDAAYAPTGMMHSNSGSSVGEPKSIDDLYAMLNNSAQRGPMPNNPAIRPSQSPSLHLIQQQQILQHQQQQQLLNASRLDALYDSRLDDRNFVPDGMVPGLRTAPPPRRRNDGLDAMEDQMQFNARHPNPQQRALEQLYNGSVPGMYGQQVGVGRNAGIPLQQQQFRGGPSPINHNALHNPQQRLPPGLANLGGRPPHEPSQLAGMVGMHNTMLAGGPQQFNNFPPGGITNFNGPQRGPLSPHQLSGGPVGHNMNPLGHPGNQGLNNQLQGMVGLNGGNALRGNGGFTSPPIQGGQGLGNGFPMRQQPQSMMPPPSHPSHLQQQPQGFASSGSQPAHELMALLMGGQPRGE